MNPKIMRAAGFAQAVERHEAGRCPFCNLPIKLHEFRDTLSLKEHQISGLCQGCQDETFK